MPTHRKCFFIDDDEDDRDFFCTAVHTIDSTIECLFAKDGEQALNKLLAQPSLIPDYIFIDMNMPMMDGKQCLTEIRRIDRLDDVPVYIYSTSGTTKLIHEVLEIGAKEFLIKPSSMTALEQMLRAIVT